MALSKADILKSFREQNARSLKTKLMQPDKKEKKEKVDKIALELSKKQKQKAIQTNETIRKDDHKLK